MHSHRLADIRRELERTHDAVQRSRLEYELCRELLEQAIDDAERSHRRLVSRLATVDRRAKRAAYGLRDRRPAAPPPEPRRRQRSSTTISVAHATAS